MDEYEAYKLFIALRAHFTTNYDFFKYNGEIAGSTQKYETRPDRYQFQKLARQKDPWGLIVANLIEAEVKWVGHLFKPEAQDRYFKWKKRQESLSYIFKQDIDQLDHADFDANLKIIDGSYPPLLKLYQHKKICIETLIILDDLLGFFPYWDKHLDKIIWGTLKKKCDKYKRFVKYDKSKYQDVLLTTVGNPV
jgi:hypothetical protein